MSVPIVTLPSQGPIATRPRAQLIYDTEAVNDATAVPAKLTLFRNLTAFQEANISLSKISPRDTNLETAGSLGKGDQLHWYGTILPISARNSDLTTQTNAVVFGEIAQLRMNMWYTFYFSSTPYFKCQADQIPAGVGMPYVMTTLTEITVYAPQTTRCDKDAFYDVTLSGQPTVITEQENFRAELETLTAAPTGFSPTVELFITNALKGMLLKGIR